MNRRVYLSKKIFFLDLLVRVHLINVAIPRTVLEGRWRTALRAACETYKHPLGTEILSLSLVLSLRESH